jgi:hypothetical protein
MFKDHATQGRRKGCYKTFPPWKERKWSREKENKSGEIKSKF